VRTFQTRSGPAMTASGAPTPDLDALVDALADALDELPRQTCPSMVPLWLATTLGVRRRFGVEGIAALPFKP